MEEQSILTISLEHAWDINKTWILHSFKEFLHVCQIPVHIFYSPTSFWFPRLYVLSICCKNFLASSAGLWFSIFHGAEVSNEGLRTMTQEVGNLNSDTGNGQSELNSDNTTAKTSPVLTVPRVPEYFDYINSFNLHHNNHEVGTILIIPILKMRTQRHEEVHLQGAGLGLNPGRWVPLSPPLIHTILPWVTGLSMTKEPWVSFPWAVASSSVKPRAVQVLSFQEVAFPGADAVFACGSTPHLWANQDPTPQFHTS